MSVMFYVISVPFDSPLVVSYHSFFPLYLVVIFHILDILMESP